MKSLMVCLVGLLVSVHASPVSPPVVSGQVRLADGSPVAGAQVVLFDVAGLGRGPVGQATTDEAGQFALPLTAASGALVLPQGFALGQNYPNPFNPSTIIPYQLAAASQVRLEVFNILGQHMATLVDAEQEAGSYRVRWDGTDAAGGAAASGVYFYRLTVDGAHQTGRMVLVDGQVGVPMGGARVEVMSLASGSAGSYGLVVSGEGLVAYVDADFGVEVGPVDLVVETRPQGRGKVVVPTLEGMLGDVDNNGHVDLDDGLLVAMHRVDPTLSLPNHGYIGLGDVDCNGRVERADAALLATYVVHPSDPTVSSLRIGQRGGYSLNPVTETVWGSILGTEQQDATVARLLDAVPVLVSGVFEIDGRDHLYLGIDRAYYQRHGGEPIYNALKQRFPITPLFVEASDGVQQPARRPQAEPVPPIPFSESPNQEETLPTGIGAGKAHSSDQAVLVALYEATDGDTWMNNTHWLSEKPLEDWFGVTTDENGRVTSLDLRVNGLRGSIPSALGQLQNLTYLNLRGNQLSGAIPQGLGQLQNLEKLYLYDNQLSGSIPQSLGQLQNLEVLNLRDNQLSGAIPPALGQLQSLIYLVLRVNGLSGSIPQSLGQLQNLEVLNLRDNQLSGTIPPALGQLHNLTHLNLRGNPLRGSLPASLVNLTSLEWLVVEDTQLCMPTDASFQAWLEGIENKRGVVHCTADGSGSDTPDATSEDEPTTRPDLAVSSVTASPTNPASGGLITLQITVHNHGAGAASSEVIRVYLNGARTAQPTVHGARIVQTARSGSLAAGASATRSLSTVVPSVPSPTPYYYYACVDAAAGEQQTGDNCSLEPAEVRVGGDGAVEAAEGSGLILSFSVSPTNPETGTPVTVRLTVKNDGSETVNSETIRLYRHRTRTNTPRTGGTELTDATTTGSLAAGASVTRTILASTPSVTTTTTYYYYACVDDACTDPAELRIHPTATIDPPYESCHNAAVHDSAPIGGDAHLTQYIKEGSVTSCATITLGGIETIDGTRGFIVAAHSVTKRDVGIGSDTTDILIGHTKYKTSQKLRLLLGKVHRLPTVRTEGEEKIIVDVAFVKYPHPHTPGCSLTWRDGGEAFCLDDTDQDNYVERVSPLVIRGRNGDIYRVTGSQKPTRGLKVTYSGAVTGPSNKTGTVGEKILVFSREEGISEYTYSIDPSLGTQFGDSGSPIYTVPDTNGNVHVVGVYTGNLYSANKERGLFSSWEEAAENLNLKPISP